MMHPHLICLIITLLSVAGLEIFLLIVDPNLFWIVNTILLIFLAIVGLFSPNKCGTNSTSTEKFDEFLRRPEHLTQTCIVSPHQPPSSTDHVLGSGPPSQPPPAEQVTINMEVQSPALGVGVLPSYQDLVKELQDELPTYQQALSRHVEADHI